jgi:hypothetical protein
MPGLVPGIHVFFPAKQDVDGRDKPGHDDRTNQFGWNLLYTATECRFWLAGR